MEGPEPLDHDLVEVEVNVHDFKPLPPEFVKLKKPRLRTHLTPGWFFVACTVLAFLLALFVVVFIVWFRYHGKGHTVCGGGPTTQLTNTSGVLPTISDSVTGCESETLVSAIMPVYSFLRGFQILGEHWTLMHEVSERLAPNGKPYAGKLAWKSANVRFELRERPFFKGLADRPKLWKVLAITTTALSSVAQYSLILLLAVRSEVAIKPHKAFTYLFVFAYLVYAIFDTFLRAVSQPWRYWSAMKLRFGLLLVACVAAFVFWYEAERNISSENVAKAEYVLAAAILSHGVFAAWFLKDLPLFVHSVPKAYYDGPMQVSEEKQPLMLTQARNQWPVPLRCRASPLKSLWPELTPSASDTLTRL